MLNLIGGGREVTTWNLLIRTQFHLSRTLLRLLLENLMDDIGATRALVFGVLTEMLKQEQLILFFQGYTELIILKVLESHRDSEKDVSNAMKLHYRG